MQTVHRDIKVSEAACFKNICEPNICKLQKFVLILFIYGSHFIQLLNLFLSKLCYKYTSVHSVFESASDPPCCSYYFLSTEGDVGLFIRADLNLFIGQLQQHPISNANSFIYKSPYGCRCMTKNCTDNTKHVNIIEKSTAC